MPAFGRSGTPFSWVVFVKRGEIYQDVRAIQVLATLHPVFPCFRFIRASRWIVSLALQYHTLAASVPVMNLAELLRVTAHSVVFEVNPSEVTCFVVVPVAVDVVNLKPCIGPVVRNEILRD